MSELAMKPERKPCSVCGGLLRAHNTSGVHTACKSGKPRAPKLAAVAPLEPPKAGTPPSLERFRTVAEALGFEPDEVLAELAQGWLERIRKAVKSSTNPQSGGESDGTHPKHQT